MIGHWPLEDRTPIAAAVLNVPGRLDFEEVYLDLPGPDEVLVRPVSVGLCHSDLHYIDGTHTTEMPEVLGHEAAGVVESVGSRVTDVSVGDHVVTSLTMFCGTCGYCVSGRMSLCSSRARLRERPAPALVNAKGQAVGVMGGIGAFASRLLIHRNGVVSISSDVPFDVASLFGCAVLTGVGAVTRSAKVPVGATVAVIGCGGVGLAVVQGARLAGASRIVAVDLDESKLEVARQFGATDVIRGDASVAAEINALVPGGVDYSFEAIGRQSTAELALAVLAPGGVCVVLGMVPDSTPIRVPASELYFREKRIQGAFIGSSRFTVDVPSLLHLYARGELPVDRMISHRFRFDQLNEGFSQLAAGGVLRAVVDMGA